LTPAITVMHRGVVFAPASSEVLVLAGDISHSLTQILVLAGDIAKNVRLTRMMPASKDPFYPPAQIVCGLVGCDVIIDAEVC
jgi:hypothetical protein